MCQRKKFLVVVAVALSASLMPACSSSSPADGDASTDSGPDPADAAADALPPDVRATDLADSGTDAATGEAGTSDAPATDTPAPQDAPDSGADTGLEDLQADADAPDPQQFAIKISSPAPAADAHGTIDVRIEPVDADYKVLDSLDVKVNGTTVFADTKLPTSFRLDTSEYPDGALDISAEAVHGPFDASDAVALSIANAPFHFKSVYTDDYVYRNGDQVEVTVSSGKSGVDVSADFSDLDSGYAPGAEDVYEIGGGKYLVSYTLSAENQRPDGEHTIGVTVGDGQFSLENHHLTVALQNLPALPIRVEGGIFVPASLPEPTPNWNQPISKVSGNDYIITGGSAKVDVDFSAFKYPKELVGILVGMEGYSGHYQVPVSDSEGVEQLLVLMKTFVEGENPPGTVELRIAVKDARGTVSQYKTHGLTVKPVGSGDIQVSISWDTATDVDLHVVEPSGCELYYGFLQCPSGGWLDLDSNPACFMDNINNENVYWPEGKAPVGTYIVRVDFYEDCSMDGANYTVTVHACGTMDIYEGKFAPGADDTGSEGSGVTVATFSNENCGRVVRGRIRYEDRTLDRDGFGIRTWKPVRYGAVELHRASDHELLASGHTDRLGNYEIQFANKGEPGVYIIVKSETDFTEGLRRIRVMNHPKFQVVYALPSPSVNEEEEEYPVINLDIPEVVGAGAFNILDVLIGGYDLVRLMTGKSLGDLYSFWATGADTTDTLYCSQYFYDNGICSQKSALSVQGKDTDRDEYDDLVILKEFFKFALEKVSVDSNPGGSYDGTWDDPRRAWSEGVSAFFACDVAGTRWFVNSRPAGVYLVEDLEGMSSPFAYGTANQALSGAVSPLLVSAVLTDLADGLSDEEPVDAVQGLRLGVYDTIFNYFPSFHNQDRGVQGVDFVDFLDGWFCREWGDTATVTDMVVTDRKFPYDFGGPELCIH